MVKNFLVIDSLEQELRLAEISHEVKGLVLISYVQSFLFSCQLIPANLFLFAAKN